MTMSIYIISDLHLKPTEMTVVDQFKFFLNSITSKENTLFILGDFFEYSIGDDNPDPFYQNIIQLLKNANLNGLKTYFIHGNRDFLLGKRFEQESLCQILPDPYFLKINHTKIMLSHGDLLCTDDIKYLRYRKVVQSKCFKFLFLKLPLKFRLYLAKKMRQKSKNNKRFESIFDVTEKGIKLYAKDSDIIIHGHTHKLAIWQHQNLIRYVLGDWHTDQSSFIKIDKNNDKNPVTLFKNNEIFANKKLFKPN